MQISNLSLKDFRNYQQKSFDFSSNPTSRKASLGAGTTLLAGDNGKGKTNVLEAIYLLATGKSFRARRDQEMILYGKELARISGDIEDPTSRGASLGASDALEVVITTGELQGERVPKKRYLVNGAAKRKMDFVGKIRVVLFRPEDIELILGSPSSRREYLDSVLEQVDGEYRRSSLAYVKGLRRRNKLLYKIREGEAERNQLLFWNKMILKNGELIQQKRKGFLEYVSERLKERGLELRLEYDRSVISESRLEQYAMQEVASGTTLVGPHRDDFVFITQREGKVEKDLSIYGSRGEQRMAVFQVKLVELEYMDKREGYELSRGVRNLEDRPILLLDDVFSELDKEHRREVFKLLDKQQTIISTADESLMPKRYLKKVEIVRL